MGSGWGNNNSLTYFLVVVLKRKKYLWCLPPSRPTDIGYDIIVVLISFDVGERASSGVNLILRERGDRCGSSSSCIKLSSSYIIFLKVLLTNATTRSSSNWWQLLLLGWTANNVCVNGIHRTLDHRDRQSSSLMSDGNAWSSK